MKQFIIIIGLGVICIIVSLTLLSVQSTSDRRTDLNRAVSAAVKQTVKDSQAHKQDDFKSKKEMVAYFINILSTNIKSDGDIVVKVMGANVKQGMLDVCVTQKFKYLNGKSGKVSVRKCAIYE